MKGKPFGLRLNIVRCHKRLSVEELASKSGISESTLYNLESGLRPLPNSNTLIKLCKTLDVSSDHLLGLED